MNATPTLIIRARGFDCLRAYYMAKGLIHFGPATFAPRPLTAEEMEARGFPFAAAAARDFPNPQLCPLDYFQD